MTALNEVLDKSSELGICLADTNMLGACINTIDNILTKAYSEIDGFTMEDYNNMKNSIVDTIKGFSLDIPTD